VNTATGSVWAVVNHNSDFAAITVPEPGTGILFGLGILLVGAKVARQRRKGERG
jgi:hypothetical protein